MSQASETESERAMRHASDRALTILHLLCAVVVLQILTTVGILIAFYPARPADVKAQDAVHHAKEIAWLESIAKAVSAESPPMNYTVEK